MKNTENAAMPISAIVYWRFLPRRRSGSPAQVSPRPRYQPIKRPNSELESVLLRSEHCPKTNPFFFLSPPLLKLPKKKFVVFFPISFFVGGFFFVSFSKCLSEEFLNHMNHL